MTEKSEGWAWYEDPEEQQKQQDAPLSDAMSAKEAMHSIKEELDECLSRAVINPTPENVEAYIRLQKIWVEKSKLFSRQWQKVLLEHPELDPLSSSMAVSHYGRQIQKRLTEQERNEKIKQLSENYGLFYFFDGSVASQAFAKVVKKFAKRHNWTVVAVSVAGVSIDEFAYALPDNGISETFGVKALPSLYVIDSRSKQARAVAFGMASLEDIERNILLQFEEGT